MKPLPSFLATCATLVLLAVSLEPARAATAGNPELKRAHKLYQRAVGRLADGAHEERQLARLELEEARHLDPANLECALALARVYLDTDMLACARRETESILARDSANAEAEYLLGLTWRRSWLIDPDSLARNRAILHLARALHRAPNDGSRWIPLVPLLVEAGEIESARNAANFALQAAPASFEAMLLAAYTAQRTGDFVRADRLFTAALERMPKTVRNCFEDLEPLIPAWTTESYRKMNHRERTELATKFWHDADPDPVTVENEGKLEFLARATHAYFLYYRPESGTWDLRGDLYVRYGPPTWTERNSIMNPDAALEGNWLAWTYPELGMRVWMEANNPLVGYRMPFSRYAPPAMPYRDSLARREDLVAVQGGWVVFPKLPPTVRPLELRCALARFEGETGRRLLAQAESPGSPDDSLWAEWAVLDTAYAEVARASRPMSVSACWPGEAQAASFASDLRPGRYRVGIDVTDSQGHRGVFRKDIAIPESGSGLSLSDVVVTCGRPQASVLPGHAVRLEPDPGLRPALRDVLTAYFEIYHLRPDAQGTSRIEYACAVRSATKDRRSWFQRTFAPLPPPIEMTREVESYGALRRQYVSVPLRDLPPGQYQIEIRVRNLDSGEETTRLAAFARGE